MPNLTIKGISFYYETHGDAEPLVYIAGVGLDLSEYDDYLIRPLSKHFKVLAFDNRGSGRSDKPDEPYSIAMMADDTIGLMDALGIEKAVVVGLSLGGRIAMELALSYPERVEKLVLVSTSARVKNTWRRPMLGVLRALTSLLPFKSGKYPQPRYAFKRQLQASSGYDATSRLSSLTVPTLILHGRKDKLVPFHLVEEMHAAIRNSQLKTFEGGHLLFVFEPQKLLEAIVSFAG